MRRGAIGLGSAVALLLAGVLPAEAHLLGASGAGLAEGFAHPFSGLDHLLAMIAVGFWAAELGGAALIALPLAFPAMMAVGALVGGAGVPVPGVELGIAASVVLLGLLVAAGVRLPLVASVAIVSVFALVHGHSHGAELPEAASSLLYGLGFLAATLTLHAIGLLLGSTRRMSAGPLIARAVGSVIAAAGVVMTFAAA